MRVVVGKRGAALAGNEAQTPANSKDIWAAGDESTADAASCSRDDDGVSNEDVQSQRAHEAKAKGNLAFSQGDFGAAVQHFTTALLLQPENHLLWSNRSAAHQALGAYCAALADADTCLHIAGEGFLKGHYRRGRALFSLECWEAVLDACDQGLAQKACQPQLDKLAAETETQLLRGPSPQLRQPPPRADVTLKVGKVQHCATLTLCDGTATMLLLSQLSRVPVDRLKVVHKGVLLNPSNVLQRLGTKPNPKSQAANRPTKQVLQVVGLPRADESGCHPDDVAMIVDQLVVDRNTAVAMLKAAKGDVVDAIRGGGQA